MSRQLEGGAAICFLFSWEIASCLSMTNKCARDDETFVVASPRCRNIINVETAGRGRGNLLFSLIKLL